MYNLLQNAIKFKLSVKKIYNVFVINLVVFYFLCWQHCCQLVKVEVMKTEELVNAKKYGDLFVHVS